MSHESYRVHATVVVFNNGKLVIPAREEDGSSVGNILLNVRARNYAAFGPSVDVRLSDVREVPIRRY